jgi:membrane associated rhomboid family serine protease
MNISVRRACLVSRASTFRLRTCQGWNHVIAFESSFLKPLQHQLPRYFSSKSRQRPESKSRLLWGIVAANTAVFVAWQYDKLPNNAYHNPTIREIHRWKVFLAENFVLNLANIKKGHWWTVITAEFSHQQLFHYAFNMMTFVSFGQMIVHSMPHVGPLAFGGLCLGSILSASAAFLLHSNGNDYRSGLGASGMVCGVLAAITCAAPSARVAIFGFIPCQMWMSTLAFFAIDAGVLGLDIWSPIAHDAHLGGSVFGTLYYLLVMRRLRLPRW